MCLRSARVELLTRSSLESRSLFPFQADGEGGLHLSGSGGCQCAPRRSLWSCPAGGPFLGLKPLRSRRAGCSVRHVKDVARGPDYS